MSEIIGGDLKVWLLQQPEECLVLTYFRWISEVSFLHEDHSELTYDWKSILMLLINEISVCFQTQTNVLSMVLERAGLMCVFLSHLCSD